MAIEYIGVKTFRLYKNQIKDGDHVQQWSKLTESNKIHQLRKIHAETCNIIIELSIYYLKICMRATFIVLSLLWIIIYNVFLLLSFVAFIWVTRKNDYTGRGELLASDLLNFWATKRQFMITWIVWVKLIQTVLNEWKNEAKKACWDKSLSNCQTHDCCLQINISWKSFSDKYQEKTFCKTTAPN